MSLAEAIVTGWAFITLIGFAYLFIHGAPAFWTHLAYDIFFVTWIPIMTYRAIRYLSGRRD